MATKKTSSKRTGARKKSSSASGKYVEQEMQNGNTASARVVGKLSR